MSKTNDVFRLTNLDIEEVSIVDKGANKKKFVLVKRDAQETLEILKKAQDGDSESLKLILTKIFENVSEATLKEIGLQRFSNSEEDGDPEGASSEDGEENSAEAKSDADGESSEEKEEKEKSDNEDGDTTKSDSKIDELQKKLEKAQNESQKIMSEFEDLKTQMSKIEGFNSQTQGDSVNKSDSDDSFTSDDLGCKPLNE